MQMVSAAKMRRAQENVEASRPYAQRIRQMITALSGLTDIEAGQFPLLETRPINRVGVVLITPDKGLAGPLSTNLIRRTLTFLQDEAEGPADLVTVGRKGRDFFIRRQFSVEAEFTGMPDWPTIQDLRPVVDVAIDDFIRGKTDAVYLIYARFINTLTQRPEVLKLLPIEAGAVAGEEEAEPEVQDFIFEPTREIVLEALLPRYIEVQLYQAMLEALASEHSARMVAMQSATDNANELREELTLSYNKARQSQITSEVSEIAAGALAQR